MSVLDINLRITIAIEVNGEEVARYGGGSHAGFHRVSDPPPFGPAYVVDEETDKAFEAIKPDFPPINVPHETHIAPEDPVDASDPTEQTLLERAGVYAFYDDDQG